MRFLLNGRKAEIPESMAEDRLLWLEPYVHTRHPILFLAMEATSARLVKPGHSDDQPSPAMDPVLAGVRAGLLAAIGCRDVRLTIGEGDRALCVVQDGVVADFITGPKPTGLWHFSWREGPRHPASDDLPADLTAPGAGQVSREAARLMEADLIAI